MFNKVIWGADNICVHCGREIKFWQSYIRPSIYVVHEKCFDDYMRERKKGIPRNKTAVEIATSEVMEFKESSDKIMENLK